MKRIAILGTGGVGQAYASKFVALRHEVMLGTRNVAEKLADTPRDGNVSAFVVANFRRNRQWGV